MNSASVSSFDPCEDAGLFVTFYIRAENDKKQYIEKEQEFIDLLSHKLNLSKSTKQDDYWYDDENRISVMLLRYPFLHHDTTVVQLTMNADDSKKSAGEAWELLSEKFRNIILGVDLELAWGYTMVFQALRCYDETDETETLKGLFRKLIPAPQESFEEKAIDRLNGGILCLVGLPKNFTAAERVITYMAISDYNDSDTLVYNTLFGENTELVWHNLIIHKSYYQFLQIPTIKKINEARQRLRNAGRKLLTEKASKSRFEDILLSTQKLQEVTDYIYDFRRSLDQQRFNYKEIQKKYTFCKNSRIISYYNSVLAEMYLSIKLSIRSNDREVREALQKIELAQARVNDIQSKWEQEKQWMLALLAAALAVPQLVDGDAAWSITQSTLIAIQAMGFHLPFDAKWNNEAIALSMSMRLVALAIQILLIGAVFFLLKWMINKFNELMENEI